MSKVRRRSSRQRTAHHRSRQSRFMQGESLENRLLLASDWQNFAAPLDVNHDEAVSPADVLSVVNFLNENGAQQLPEKSEAEGGSPRQMSVDVNGDGNLSPGDALAVVNFLNAEGEDGPLVQYRIAIFDATGTTEVETVGLGEEFVAKVFLSDIRMSGRAGVFSGYLDINYESDLASVVPDAFMQLDLNTFETVSVTIMDNQDNYGNGRSGDFSTPGVIDGVGSFSGSTLPLGPTERELFKVKFRADTEGTITLVGSPTTEAEGDPGQSPSLDTGLFNSDNPVCPSEAIDNSTGLPLCRGEMMFINDSVTIVSDIVAVGDSLTVDEDSGTSSPINVLSNDIVNIGSLNLESFTAALNGQVVQNNDNTFTYTPNANYFGSDSFTYTINNGQGATSSATVDITVNPINDGPINSVPGSQTIDEDTDLVFSGGELSVADVDADSGSGLQVTLSVSNGNLTVATSAATVNGDGGSSVTIEGSVANVNAALNGLRYTPIADFNGQDSLSVTTNDLGNFGAGGALSDVDTVAITINPINDAPVNTVPGPQTVFNTETLAFGSGTFQVTDIDADTIEVQLTVSQGTLSFGTTADLQLTGNDSTALTASGSIAAINNGLGSLVYDPTDGFIGNDTLTLTSSDLGGTGAGGVLTDVDTVAIRIAPPETPFAAGDFFTIDEDTSTALTFDLNQLLGNDLAPMPVGSNTLALTQINGLAPSTSAFVTSGGGALGFDSSAGTFTYSPAAEFSGRDTFTYTIESSPDVGDGPSTGTVSIDVQPINDGPVNTIPGPLSLDEDSTLTFSGSSSISVADVDAGNGIVTVELSVASGRLSVASSGATVAGNNSSSVILDGTIAQLNGALSGLQYTPNANFFGLDPLSVTTRDNGNSGGISGDPNAANPLTAADTVQITVQPINDAPTIVVPGQQSFITDFDNILSAANANGLTVSDVDAGSDDIQLDLSIGAGTLTVADISQLSSVTGNGTNSVRLLGSVTGINAALGSGINYRVDASGAQALSATVNDLGNNGGVSGDPNAVNPLTDSATVDIEVLDFVPSTLGGSVFIDLNQDGQRGPNEPGLEGIEIKLSGTDGITGTSIDPVTATTDSGGNYGFPNLRPGNYFVDKMHPDQFIDGQDRFESPVVAAGADRGQVDIDIRGGINSTSNDFGILGLNGQFFDGIHLQTPQQPGGPLYNNLLFAIDSSDPSNPAKTAVLYSGDQWAGYSNARVSMSTDGRSVTVEMFEAATNSWKSATFTFESARFRMRTTGSLSTIRVFFTPDMLTADSVGSTTTTQFAQAVDAVMTQE